MGDSVDIVAAAGVIKKLSQKFTFTISPICKKLRFASKTKYSIKFFKLDVNEIHSHFTTFWFWTFTRKNYFKMTLIVVFAWISNRFYSFCLVKFYLKSKFWFPVNKCMLSIAQLNENILSYEFLERKKTEALFHMNNLRKMNLKNFLHLLKFIRKCLQSHL